MNKMLVFLFLGIATATAYAVRSHRDTATDADASSKSDPPLRGADGDTPGAQRITGATAATVVTGHDAEESDPLRPDHRLTEAEAKAVRAEGRKRRTSPNHAQGVNTTREQMYRDPASNAGGESGTQGGGTGREDNNPVGRHK